MLTNYSCRDSLAQKAQKASVIAICPFRPGGGDFRRRDLGSTIKHRLFKKAEFFGLRNSRKTHMSNGIMLVVFPYESCFWGMYRALYTGSMPTQKPFFRHALNGKGTYTGVLLD